MMKSAKQLHDISTEKQNEALPVDSNLSLDEIEHELEMRAKSGMYNYFYYIIDSKEITILSGYFPRLGFKLEYIPANSSSPYLGIMKISW